MYNVKPGITAKALAAIGNWMMESRVAPTGFLDNIVTLIPKVSDPFHTGLYRPITLTNTDYKIIMAVWASRLGPILNEIIGEHQKGFIPGRDG